ncbi:copper-binding protein [Dyella jiangningensis]|nr:copper-binding protein [Dyella jiangningensis]AHX13415.1 copper-binding protein [Dyella jiangningensis]
MMLASISAVLTVPALAAPQSTDAAMQNMPGMTHAAAPTDPQAVGIVKAIDTAKGTVTLQHEAIKAIGWPAMTMPFKVASPDLLKNLKVGDKVQFTLRPAGTNTTVTAITPMP